MKYFIVARHANWLGSGEEFQADARQLAEKLRAVIGNLSPIILTSDTKRAFETGILLAKELQSQPPISSNIFRGYSLESEVREFIAPFFNTKAVIIVCHEENSKIIMGYTIQMIGLPDTEVKPLFETATANVLDCESGHITHISHS